jgi:hypothetical protein
VQYCVANILVFSWRRGEWLLRVFAQRQEVSMLSLTPPETAAEIDSLPSTKWFGEKFEIDSHVLTVYLPLILPSFLLQRSFG